VRYCSTLIQAIALLCFSLVLWYAGSHCKRFVLFCVVLSLSRITDFASPALSRSLPTRIYISKISVPKVNQVIACQLLSGQCCSHSAPEPCSCAFEISVGLYILTEMVNKAGLICCIVAYVHFVTCRLRSQAQYTSPANEMAFRLDGHVSVHDAHLTTLQRAAQ